MVFEQNGNRYNTIEAEKVIEKMKKDQEEEDKKMQFYYEEKNRREIEKERQLRAGWRSDY